MLKLNKLNDKSRDGRTLAIIEDSNAEPQGILKILDNSGSQMIELPPGLVFAPTPETRESQRDVIMVSGASGAGKSVWASNYARHFIHAFNATAERIFVISADDVEDPAFNFPHRHIKIDEQMIAQPIELEELTDKEGQRTLCIFDDIEGVSNPKLQKATESLTQRVLELGRKRLISCIFICHRAAAGKATKYVLNELDSFVFFPKFSTGRNITYCLTHHLGVPEGMREALKGDGWGRWVMLKTKAPQVIISEQRAAIYDADECAKALKKRNIVERKRAQIEATNSLNF